WFFPKDLPKKDWLTFLASKFKTVEVNTTFYHMARVSTFEKWKKEVPTGFLFTLKFYRLFTHIKKLNFEKAELETLVAFFKNGSKLGRKLGPILIQFPPSMFSRWMVLAGLVCPLLAFACDYTDRQECKDDIQELV